MLGCSIGYIRIVTHKEIQHVVLVIQLKINVKEERRGNKKWTIQINRQHKTKKNKTKAQHNLCCTPLHTNNTNKTRRPPPPTTTNKTTQRQHRTAPPPPPPHAQTNGGKDKTEHSFHAEIARDFTTLNTERKKCLYIKESRSICTLWNFPFQIFQLINECCFVSVYTK